LSFTHSSNLKKVEKDLSLKLGKRAITS